MADRRAALRSAATPLIDPATHADRWLAAYRQQPLQGDALAGSDDAAWRIVFEELAASVGDDLGAARERVQRQAEDIGTGFRIIGEKDERPWPVSPVPLVIPVDEWRHIEAGVAQRAELLETIVADLYGAGNLVSRGEVPAAVVAGSPLYLRALDGVAPAGGRHLHFVAFDLGRGPTGEWRVLADHVRAPAGAGYALENRLAVSRTLDGLPARLNVLRHAPFFAAFREGLAAACRRADPRIGLLTPGRYDPSYAEQAHLARYLGFLLVEGDDLAVLDERVYVRTIAGLKRIDALWRRVDPRMLDPLAFDARSLIGVPALVDALANGELAMANAPGAAVIESPAFAAFLPRLAVRLTGGDLILPNIATWWCGQERERERVVADLDRLLVAPAFATAVLGLDGLQPVAGAELSGEARARLLADMQQRPQDYVGREIVRLSTMPVVAEASLVPRPFTLRVFAARDGDGAWQVMPGGFARIGENADPRLSVMGEGNWSADVIVHGDATVEAVSLLADDTIHLRRNPGTLPSRVADNLFWLGRYLERGEALLKIIRVMLGASIDADVGAALSPRTTAALVALVEAGGAADTPAKLRRAELSTFARTAFEAPVEEYESVRAINGRAAAIAGISRDRLANDMYRLLDAPWPAKGGLLERAASLQRRYAALSGLSSEHMGRTTAWRFHDLGRRIERALAITRAMRSLGVSGASADDLTTLLELADSQITYRQRYLTGMARLPVVDLIALDPGNPRALAFQAEAICEHLRCLPVLADDGMAEPQQAQATALKAIVDTADSAGIDAALLDDVERRLTTLSDAVGRRYFLQGAEPLRESGLTLA